MLDEFVAKKKVFDRSGIFGSSFYERYFAPQN
jgi:hypothetical protein